MITLRGKLKRSTVSRPKVADAAAITQRQPGSAAVNLPPPQMQHPLSKQQLPVMPSHQVQMKWK
jgi:hypothetical protein